MATILVSKEDTDLLVIFVNKKEAKANEVTNRLGKSFKFATVGDRTYVLTKKVKTGDDWRNLAFGLVQHLNGLNVETVSIDLTDDMEKVAFVEGLVLGDYNFQMYKSKPTESTLKKICLVGHTNCDVAVNRALVRAHAQCDVRNIVNGTPTDMNSTTILNLVLDTFKGTGIIVNVYDQYMLRELGMNGHIAVNCASPHPAMTIKLTHTPAGFKKHIVMVGKGLTYDCGGLSIKTNGHMADMKSDKAGAITLFGIMKAISELGCDHKVTAYLALAENVIAGDAYKPDDVLLMKNKKTVHVKDTDAEGRIVLFDNLCLAEEENPNLDELYTFATLTGAAIAQFGLEAAGMVGFNNKMKKTIKSVGEEQGEIFCDAEFHKFMMDSVEDSVADIANLGTKYQGCQKAGLFLTYALTEQAKKKYLHLDIAGPAWAEAPFGSNKKGGTGFAVRTFLSYLGV